LHNVVNTKKALKEAKWLVNLDLPSAKVPGELFDRLFGRLDREVGQQQPIEGLFAGGRLSLGGEQGGDGDVG